MPEDEVVELKKKPGDREVEFSKITDAVNVVRDDFLSSEEMSIEDAITRIQGELTKLMPRPEPSVEAIAATRPPGLSELGT